MLSMLCSAPAELKLVIAGNHDITLHDAFYASPSGYEKHGKTKEDVAAIRELWTGEQARRAGVVYVEEGMRTFELKSGVMFTVYASPWQPEFYDWAFTYPRDVDRFNPGDGVENPVPDFPGVDVMITHGPPRGVMDVTHYGKKSVGCDHLKRAVERCRPRLHCFGHIHEGWGCERRDWGTGGVERVEVDRGKVERERGVFVDISGEGKRGLRWGEETLFVNASIMDVRYRAVNAPWVVDLDLPVREHEG